MFQTATIGAAHSACFIGSNIPSTTSQSSSFLPSPSRNTGHCLPYNTLQYFGVASGSTVILALDPVTVPRPGSKTGLYFNLKCSLIPTYYIRATMLFCMAHSVPYAMKVRVEEELEQLVKQGILEPMEFAKWAAPIVPVVKSAHLWRLQAHYQQSL